jgi:hypothetical protein
MNIEEVLTPTSSTLFNYYEKEKEITKEERDPKKKEKRHHQNSNKLTIGPPWVHVEPSHWLHEIFVSKIVCHHLFTWLDAKP